MITLDEFFELFEEELKTNKNLQHYHRFINDERMYKFRTAYYQQRLKYMLDQVSGKIGKVFDVGCGYGTSSILLAAFGHNIVGATLEYYYDEICTRLEFWKKYIDVSQIEFKYENLFFSDYEDESFDYIIAQDTLHHLEPINDALSIFGKILKPDGTIIVSEENGNNPIGFVKNIKQRGFKRVIKIYDEKLGQYIWFGNENTRSLKKWNNLFNAEGLKIIPEKTEYIRILPPASYKNKDMSEVIYRESEIQRKHPLLADKLFFGINFCAKKNE